MNYNVDATGSISGARNAAKWEGLSSPQDDDDDDDVVRLHQSPIIQAITTSSMKITRQKQYRSRMQTHDHEDHGSKRRSLLCLIMDHSSCTWRKFCFLCWEEKRKKKKIIRRRGTQLVFCSNRRRGGGRRRRLRRRTHASEQRRRRRWAAKGKRGGAPPSLSFLLPGGGA